MRIINQIAAVTAATAFGLAALAGPTFAQKADGKARAQLTYEQAWAQCKKFVDAGVASWDQTSQRYARGAACMKKFGHRI